MPLVIRIPGGPKGKVVEYPVSTLDVAPTLLAFPADAIDFALQLALFFVVVGGRRRHFLEIRRIRRER